MMLLVLLVFAVWFPMVGALIWWGLVMLVEITVCLLQVLAVLALLAIRLLAALTRWAWDAWRRPRRARLPQPAKAPAAVTTEHVAPVLASGHWWDAVPDDAFVPPLNWRLRKALGLPVRPLPRVEVPALTLSPGDLKTSTAAAPAATL